MSKSPDKNWRWFWASDVLKTDLHTLDQKSETARQQREHTLTELSKSDFSQLADEEPLTLLEDIAAMILLFIFPGSMFWFPFVILGLLFWAWHFQQTLTLFYVLLAATGLLTALGAPQSWPAFMHSSVAKLIVRYFSFKVVYSEFLDPTEQYIFGAPPHGVFPIGNILTMLTIKSGAGFYFKGLAASAALTLPILKTVLGWIGGVKATRKEAHSWLNKGESLGISVGGVAEIFETNQTDEAVFLHERKGFIKLAMQHGATVVPCFLFGNTKTLNTWYDSFGIAKRVSRKLGFGTILLWGRFFLPIMMRKPIVGVLGRHIKCPKVENPTRPEVAKYHAEFVEGIIEIFETHKEAYGWGHKKLIIK